MTRRMRIRTTVHPWVRPRIGALVCAVFGEHRVRFFRMGSDRRFLEQCRWCWHAWDETGQFVL